MVLIGPQHYIKEMVVIHRKKNDFVVRSSCTSSLEGQECPEILRKQKFITVIKKAF